MVSLQFCRNTFNVFTAVGARNGARGGRGLFVVVVVATVTEGAVVVVLGVGVGMVVVVIVVAVAAMVGVVGLC
jgi:hypothetical protein